MGTFFPFLVIIMMAAMTMATTAYPYQPSGWVPVVNVEKDVHVQYVGEFAVKRYNEQNNAYLKFLQVVEAKVLDRGTEYYTYELVIKVHNGYLVKLYKSRVPAGSVSTRAVHCP